MGRYLGQHFLNDKAVISHAIQSILPQENGILEVGPGAMALTEHLIKQAAPILLVERDEKLLPYIEKRLKPTPTQKSFIKTFWSMTSKMRETSLGALLASSAISLISFQHLF